MQEGHNNLLQNSIEQTSYQNSENSVPEQKNNPVEKTKNNNFLIGFLSTLLLISCFIAGFFAYQTQTLVKELSQLKTSPIPSSLPVVKQTEIPEATDIPKTDETEDWKIYSGKIFSFKYPKKMSLKQQEYSVENSSIMGDMVTLSDSNYEIKINSDFNGGWGGNICVKTEDKIISGKESQILYFGVQIPESDKCDSKYDGLVALIGNKMFEHPYPVLIDMKKKENVDSVDLDLFNQILSTFKFTN